MSDRHPLPDAISLTRDEAKSVLFALDSALDAVPPDEAVFLQVEAAVSLLIAKFLPDLPNL